MGIRVVGNTFICTLQFVVNQAQLRDLTFFVLFNYLIVQDVGQVADTVGVRVEPRHAGDDDPLAIEHRGRGDLLLRRVFLGCRRHLCGPIGILSILTKYVLKKTIRI